MMRFVRRSGGALGVILAISLLGLLDRNNTFFDPSIFGRVLLVAWICAWFVVGYAIIPYITVEPAKRVMRAVGDLSTGEFLTAVAGPPARPADGRAARTAARQLPRSLPLDAAARRLDRDGPRHDGPDRRQARRPARGRQGRGPVQSSSGCGPASSAVDAGPITYVDTSAIIDGRVVDVVASGFLYGTLVVPRFVLGELQHIADDSEPGRRARGRRGLEILSVLQKDHRVALELTNEDARDVSAVDAKLVALAGARRAAVLTTDYNLNRVAQLQGVRVMNLNQLANAMKPAFLPGEAMKVKVIQQGKEPGQGVAFLEDGTMIVVEGGGSYLQHELDVTVTRVLQTVAGRMVFAQPNVLAQAGHARRAEALPA